MEGGCVTRDSITTDSMHAIKSAIQNKSKSSIESRKDRYLALYYLCCTYITCVTFQYYFIVFYLHMILSFLFG